jgi:RNA:NAD 2'-phosphotransferase (TPT1/KptA family)
MINAYMNDTITLKTATLDQWNAATYVSTTLRGRFEFKTKMVRNLQGEQVVSSARVYLASRAIGHNDKIVYGGKEYSILNIEEKKDFSTKFLRVDLA